MLVQSQPPVRPTGAVVRVDHDRRQVVRVELPQLDEDAAAVLAERRMRRAGRIADVGAGRVIAVFVGEHTLEYQEFLAFRMAMAGKRTSRRVAHDAGCPRDLVADAIQHQPVDPGFGRHDPQVVARHDPRQL